jgi:hypothetical protein
VHYTLNDDEGAGSRIVTSCFRERRRLGRVWWGGWSLHNVECI